MADRGTVVLQSTSLEGNAVISIRGFVPLGMGGSIDACSLPAPTSEENDEWYGDPTVGPQEFIEYIVYPVENSDEGAGQETQAVCLNAFGTELPRSVTLQRQSGVVDENFIEYVQEQFFYLECTAGWDAVSLKITHTDGDAGFPFAITYATVPTTREASSGLLYDYGGAPNLLGGPFVSQATMLYPPTRDGEVIASTGSLPVGQFVTIGPPLRGKIIYFQVTDQSTLPGIDFAEFQLELV